MRFWLLAALLVLLPLYALSGNYKGPGGGSDNLTGCSTNEIMQWDGSAWVCASAGAGDVTDVGPGCATGACFTDGVVTTGTSLIVWEGTGDDTNEMTLIAPENPGSDINLTLPTSTVTIAGHSAAVTAMDGTGLSVSAGTQSVATTEIGTTTWGSGSAIVWTFDASATTDPNIDFDTALMRLENGLVRIGNAGTIDSSQVTTDGDLYVEDAFEADGVVNFGEAELIWPTDRTSNFCASSAWAGQMQYDTSLNGVAASQLQFCDDDGAQRVVSTGYMQECVTIESLVDTDDDKPIWMNSAYTSVVLDSAQCHCIGACTTEADILLENDDGSAAGMTGTILCEDTTTGGLVTDLSGAEATIDQGDVVRMDVNNTPTTGDDYIICINYRVVAQ